MNFQPPRGMSNHLARYGRGGDDMLMHVNHRELKGLAALSPTGHLSTNPHTGMPEAKGLGSILGILGSIGGAVAAPFTGGMSLALTSAIGGGLGSFAGGLLDGKSFGNALLGGLGSGILGYGMGSALSGLAGAGLGAAGEGASELAKNGVQAAASTPLSALSPGVSEEAAALGVGNLTSGAGGAGGQSLVSPLVGAGGPAMPQSAVNAVAQYGGSPTIVPDQSVANNFTTATDPWQASKNQWSNIGQGIQKPSALWEAGKSNLMPMISGASLMAASEKYPTTAGGPPQQEQYNGPPMLGPRDRKYTPAPADWDYSTGKEWNYFNPSGYADGGSVGELDDPYPATTARGRKPWYDRLIPNKREWEEIGRAGAVQRGREGAELVRDLPSYDSQYRRAVPYATGGPISGPGGGLDDAIPAVINGRQPAKLSSGEYVVPAHAVSALGDGSTEAGVRQLDQMSNNLMMQKYGTPRPRSVRGAKPGLGGMRRGFADGGGLDGQQMAVLGERWEDGSGATYESMGSSPAPEDWDGNYFGRVPMHWIDDPEKGKATIGKKYFRTVPPKSLERYKPGDDTPLEWMRRIEGFPTS